VGFLTFLILEEARHSICSFKKTIYFFNEHKLLFLQTFFFLFDHDSTVEHAMRDIFHFFNNLIQKKLTQKSKFVFQKYVKKSEMREKKTCVRMIERSSRTYIRNDNRV
jgi:hypothetical protein